MSVCVCVCKCELREGEKERKREREKKKEEEKKKERFHYLLELATLQGCSTSSSSSTGVREDLREAVKRRIWGYWSAICSSKLALKTCRGGGKGMGEGGVCQYHVVHVGVGNDYAHCVMGMLENVTVGVRLSSYYAK